jgi:peptidoglycan hydrolase-like protein with peptidoglycan-binding domain
LTVATAFTASLAYAQSTGTSSSPGGTEPGKSATGTTGTDPKGSTGTSGTTGGTGAAGTMDSGKQGAKPDRADTRGKAVGGMGKEQLKKAQQALKDKGLYEGEVDGVMGPKTREALREFQKNENIQQTGRLDRETMSKLGLQASTGASDTGAAASPRTETGPSGSTSSPSNTSGTPGASGGSTMSGAGSTAPGAKK